MADSRPTPPDPFRPARVEKRSLSPVPESVAPPPSSRRSILPRELPSWVGKAAAALFAAVVLPLTMAAKDRIDAGTDLVKAEVELKRAQAETEKRRQEAYKAETEGVRAVERRVSSLEALRGEVATLAENQNSTAAQVAALTPATRPPKKLTVTAE